MNLQELELNDPQTSVDSRCFDLELIDDPLHRKRFAQLKLIGSNDEVLVSEEKLPCWSWRDFVFLIAAAILSMGINRYLFEWEFPNQHNPTPKIISLELVPDKTKEETRPKAVDVTEIEETEINIAQKEVEKTLADEPTLKDDFDVKSPVTPLVRQLNLRDQVIDVVTHYNRNKVSTVTAPQTDNLTAPGLVFDNYQRETINSPEVEKLNRWRQPRDEQLEKQIPEVSGAAGVTVGVGPSSFYKIGDACYKMAFSDIANNTPSVPFIGNGWTVSTYQKVDCDLLYLDEQIKRSDIRPAPAKTN